MDDSEVTPEKGIDQLEVLEKYKAAGGIVEQALDLIRRAAYAGMLIRTLCQLGDASIVKQCATVFSKARTDAGEKLERGIAFPTCVSVNNCACHFCPIETDAEANKVLCEGDVFTCQLGAHIDGYVTISSQTILVRPSKEFDLTKQIVPLADDKAKRVIFAAYTCADVVLRLMRPGNWNYELSEMIERVAKLLQVTPLEGVLSHNMKRFVVDGSKIIMNKQTVESRADNWQFEPYEVYNLDIVMSTGEGKAIAKDTRETVYKRQVDIDYKLKMKTSRQVFSEINKSYPTMPFTLRALTDPKKSRMAMTEIVKHSLVTSYPVLYEKDGELVARCCLTVLVMPNQTMVVTKSVMPALDFTFDFEAADVADIKALLAVELGKKKKKKNKKKTASAADTNNNGHAAAGDDDEEVMDTEE